ncbi:DNA pilot protein [Apis mellifera associated microvirus 37]|nr:DNA pilot protein [Apis mellifera associated microvirus 37]
MDPLVTSSLISAGSSFLGGLAGGKQKRPRIQDTIKALAGTKNFTPELVARYGGTVGGRIPYGTAQGIFNSQELAARAMGAKAAGIHPLVALGMNPTQGLQGIIAGESGGSAVPSALAAAGQDVSRAIEAWQTRDQRIATKIMQNQALERGALENELLRSQIARTRGSMVPPSVPVNAGHHQTVLADMPTPLGSAIGSHPLHRITHDEKGRPVQVFNSDELGDNEVLQAAHATLYSIPQFLWNHLGGRYLTDKIVQHRQRTKDRPYSYSWPKGFYK